MGRKIKVGLVYRPVNLEYSETELLIRRECGPLRMMILHDLTSKIFREHGYYTEWNDRVKMLFAYHEGYELEDIDNVVDCALRYGYFNKRIYDSYGILTSGEIQNTYIFCCEKRTLVEFVFEYFCLDIEQVTDVMIKKLVFRDLNSNIIDIEDYLYNINDMSYTHISSITSKGDILPDNIESNKNDIFGIYYPENPENEQSKSKSESKSEIKENKDISLDREIGSLPKERTVNKNINLNYNNQIEHFDSNRQNCLVKNEKNENTGENKGISTAFGCEPKPPTHSETERDSVRYGRYNNILLSDEELRCVKREFPLDWNERIERLSEYIASTGKRYKSHLATLRSWAKLEREKQTGVGCNTVAVGIGDVEKDDVNHEAGKDVVDPLYMDEDSFRDYSMRLIKSELCG